MTKILLQALFIMSQILNSFISMRLSRMGFQSLRSRSKLNSFNSEFGTEKRYPKDGYGRNENSRSKGSYGDSNRFEKSRIESLGERRVGPVEPAAVRSYQQRSSRTEDRFKGSYPPSQTYRNSPERGDNNRRKFEFDYTRGLRLMWYCVVPFAL